MSGNSEHSLARGLLQVGVISAILCFVVAVAMHLSGATQLSSPASTKVLSKLVELCPSQSVPKPEELTNEDAIQMVLLCRAQQDELKREAALNALRSPA